MNENTKISNQTTDDKKINRNILIAVSVAKSLNRIDRGNKVAATYLK
jgi:hypothetical protein